VAPLLVSPEDGSSLTRINIQWALRAYVGCTVDGDPAFPVGYFETLKTMDWNARLTMTVVARPGVPARAESVGDMSWVRFQRAVDSAERPEPTTAPTFNQCAASQFSKP
jgi:hypothetical protein